MALWSRIANTVETWPELERAAEQRFWDALTLATSDHRAGAGAVYLFGYVAEILLKTAYYRENRVPTQTDPRQARTQARQLAAAYGRPRNDHDLRYWLFVLERVRVAQHRPIDPALLGAIRYRIGLVADNWNEALRYHDAQPTHAEVQEVYDQADWLLSRYQLWR